MVLFSYLFKICREIFSFLVAIQGISNATGFFFSFLLACLFVVVLGSVHLLLLLCLIRMFVCLFVVFKSYFSAVLCLVVIVMVYSCCCFLCVCLFLNLNSPLLLLLS